MPRPFSSKRNIGSPERAGEMGRAGRRRRRASALSLGVDGTTDGPQVEVKSHRSAEETAEKAMRVS